MLFLSSPCIVITDVVFPRSYFVYVFYSPELGIDSVCFCLCLDFFLGRVVHIPNIKGLVSIDWLYLSTVVVLFNEFYRA